MSDRLSDWVLVVPGLGEIKETARVLLELAGDPALVRTQGNGDLFLVPPRVARAFTTPPVSSPRKTTARKSSALKEYGDGR